MSLKELYNEIIKTQQDIAVTYGRIVVVENELKKKINEENQSEDIVGRLEELQKQVDSVVSLLVQINNQQTQIEQVVEGLDVVDSNTQLYHDKSNHSQTHDEQIVLEQHETQKLVEEQPKVSIEDLSQNVREQDSDIDSLDETSDHDD